MISSNYEAVSSEENNCGSCKYRVKDKYEEPCRSCELTSMGRTEYQNEDDIEE